MSTCSNPAGLNIGVIKQVLGPDPEQYAVIPERFVGSYIEHVIAFDEPFPDIAIRIRIELRLPPGIFIIDQEAELFIDKAVGYIGCDIRAVPEGGFKSLAFRDHALTGYLEKSHFKA